MKTIYVSENNKQFDNELDCINYEVMYKKSQGILEDLEYNHDFEKEWGASYCKIINNLEFTVSLNDDGSLTGSYRTDFKAGNLEFEVNSIDDILFQAKSASIPMAYTIEISLSQHDICDKDAIIEAIKKDQFYTRERDSNMELVLLYDETNKIIGYDQYHFTLEYFIKKHNLSNTRMETIYPVEDFYNDNFQEYLAKDKTEKL